MPPTTTPSNPAAHQPWFQGAPWTKLLCIVWVIGHVAIHGRAHAASSSSRSGTFLSVLFFGSTGELVVGLSFLAQHLRRLEREMGSRLLISWLLWISAVVMLGLQTLVMLSAPNLLESSPSQELGTSLPAPLPYAFLGGILYWYYSYVPRLHPRFLSIAGIALSEKALQYVWVGYLLGAQGYPSIEMGVAGILASWLFFLFRRPCLPNAVANLLPWESLGNFFFLDPPPKVYAPLLVQPPRGGTHQNNPLMAARANLRPAPRPPRAAVAAAPPPQAAIDQLTAMGFGEDRVRQALQQANNNVERAADRLLMG